MVTWVDKDYGGDSNKVQVALRRVDKKYSTKYAEVDKIYSTEYSFAVVLKDGTV